MLEFYEFNTTNIIIVLISTFIIYQILIKTIVNNNDKDKDKLNFEYLIISLIISFGVSIIVSYFLTSKEEDIMTDGYWDPIKLSNGENELIDV